MPRRSPAVATGRARLGALAVAALAACSAPTEPAATTAPTVAAGGDATPPSAPDTAAPAAPDPALQAIIADLKDRQKCNRVTGCPPLSALLSRGPAVLDPIVAELRAAPKADGYWAVALTDALGQLGDARAAEPLRQLARDPRWEVKMVALRGLGRLADRLDADTTAALVTELGAIVARPEARAEPSWAGSLRFVLARLDRAHEAEHRAALVALVPTDEAAMKAMAAPFLDTLVVLVGELRATQALPGVRLAATSDNRFVALHALEVLGTLQDTGGVPFALTRLEDGNPTIRRAANGALQRITGSGFETPAQWRKWATDHGLADIPGAAPAPQGSGGSSSPVGTGQGPRP